MRTLRISNKGGVLQAREYRDRQKLLPSQRKRVTEIHESGRIIPEGKEVESAPFRAPHHTVSVAGMFGRWSRHGNRPGEVELSYYGTLLLDDAHLFSPSMMERIGNETPPCVTVFAIIPLCSCGVEKCRCTDQQIVDHERSINRVRRALNIQE